MCKYFLFKCILVAAVVWETSTDTQTQNEIHFKHQLEIHDIPEFEILDWHQIKLADFSRKDTAVIPAIERYPLLKRAQTHSKKNRRKSESILSRRKQVERIVVRDEISKPDAVVSTIAGSKPASSVGTQISVVTPDSSIITDATKPILGEIKPSSNNVKPTASTTKPVRVPSTINKPETTKPRPLASTTQLTGAIKPDVKPGAVQSNKPLTTATVSPSFNKPNIPASVNKPGNPKPVVNIAQPVSIKPEATVNKPGAVSINKPIVSTATKPPVNKPVSTQKPIKQKPPTTTPAPLSPCKCASGVCSCCTGPILDLFSQKACIKVIYTPEDFAFDYSILLNKRVLYQDKVSGKNPRPACIGIPRLGGLRLCAKFSNIYFAGRNVHICMGIEGQWNSLDLFSIPFDCIRMGSQGFAVVKPEEGGGLPSPGVPGPLDSIIDAGEDNIEDYDENLAKYIFGSYR